MRLKKITNKTKLKLDKQKYLQSIFDYLGLYNTDDYNYKTNLYKFKLFTQYIDGLSEVSYRSVECSDACRPENLFTHLKDNWEPFFLVHDIFRISSDTENIFLQNKLSQSTIYVNKINQSIINVTESETKFYFSYSNYIFINESHLLDSLKRVIISLNNNKLLYFYHLIAFSKLTIDLLNSIVKKCEVFDNIYALRSCVTIIKVRDVNEYENDYRSRYNLLETEENSNILRFCNDCSEHFVNKENPSDIDSFFTEVEPIGIVLNSYINNYYVSNEAYYESYEYYEENYGNKFVESYHHRQSEQRIVLFDCGSPYRIGYEIEKEDGEMRNYCNIHEFNKKTDNLFRKEQDGSLCDDIGFELISPIYELNTKKIHEHFCNYKIIENHVNAEVNYETCGGHISISNINRDTWSFYSDLENYIPLFYAMYPNRCNKYYCKAKSKELLKNDNEKYQAVKIHSNRIEIRIFPAVKSLKQLMFRTKLIEIILNNPTDNYIDSYKVIKKQIIPYLLESQVYDLAMIKRLIIRMQESYAKYGFNVIDFDEETDYECIYFNN